jgi:hypothetical protein
MYVKRMEMRWAAFNRFGYSPMVGSSDHVHELPGPIKTGGGGGSSPADGCVGVRRRALFRGVMQLV